MKEPVILVASPSLSKKRHPFRSQKTISDKGTFQRALSGTSVISGLEPNSGTRRKTIYSGDLDLSHVIGNAL